ncbi:hypothetical protein AAFC00_002109 [Neodothiora populina]|uniref:Phosphoglycerate mutase-like protein n=1 Tax=Neodothiora populina TaxID=2781224 RepID=A0ABR3PGA4_9PEZI
MRLFLVRHGETVDNVAGIYAGSRDSALTNHGIQQARRLGAWFADNRLPLTHVFASPLQRAHKTAEAVSTAQKTQAVSITKVEQLVEQDFGYYEGKPFYARQRDSPSKTGREAHHDAHKSEPGFVDVESKASMAKRSDDFLDTHLIPLLESGERPPEELVVVVVSHGILLSNLWRRLLLRLPRRSLTVVPEVSAARSPLVLEHLGGWSNTGYLELSLLLKPIQPAPARLTPDNDDPSSEATAVTGHSAGRHEPSTPPNRNDDGGSSSGNISRQPCLAGCLTTILMVDGKQHLQGFKRTRGGIGRAQYDEKQKTMDSFFKRAKKE